MALVVVASVALIVAVTSVAGMDESRRCRCGVSMVVGAAEDGAGIGAMEGRGDGGGVFSGGISHC